jgi:hypothetical protein
MSTGAWIGFLIIFVGIPLFGYFASGFQGYQNEVDTEWQVHRIRDYWEDKS